MMSSAIFNQVFDLLFEFFVQKYDYFRKTSILRFFQKIEQTE